MMSPPMAAPSPVCTSMRLERLSGRAGDGVGVDAVGVGVGLDDNVGEGVGVGVGVAQTPSVAAMVSMRQPGAPTASSDPKRKRRVTVWPARLGPIRITVSI